MSGMPRSDFTEAISRIQLVTGCGTQQELAEFLGIRQSSISDAKKRGSIPSDWLLSLWRKKGIDPDWILTGQGSRWLKSVECAEDIRSPTVYIKEIKPPEECSVEELMTEVVKRVQKIHQRIDG